MNNLFIHTAGLLFFAGLLITSSDGQYFPLLNAVGVFVALIGTIMAIYHERHLSRPAPRRD